MAIYPGADIEQRIPAASLRQIAVDIFSACKMSVADAALLADALVDADLRGIHSHGLLRVPDYVAKLTTGGVDPRGVPFVVHGRGAIMVADGGNSMGQIGGDFAMRHAIELARTTGVAAVALRGSNHCGALDRYARMALANGMIGVAMTNALPTMAPWGGAEKIVGINPLAVAIPAGIEVPIVLDIAFGATAHGKIRIYHQKAMTIPEGWAYDLDGVATTDAAAALTGLIRPIGDFKGIGLALITGVFSSLLSGAAYGLESGNMVDGAVAGVDGQFFLALDIASFENPDRFRERVDGIVREIHQSRRAPGVQRLYAPGELEEEFSVRYQREGIPLNAATLHDLRIAAESFGIAAPAGW